VRGKHVFNPTNVALVVMMLVTGSVWVSPGQWGSGAVFAFLLASAGGLVVNRAARADVTCAFLACYAGLLVGRSLWLGEPLAIPLHRLENGALVLFAFFMISDPMTIPNRRGARVAYALIVAAAAFGWQYVLFRPNALVWALFLATPLVPIISTEAVLDRMSQPPKGVAPFPPEAWRLRSWTSRCAARLGFCW
jgi:Na+-transporting NADH:ubiquinone oxidoreductase subunit NqrB